jgi:hypothetical protein
MQRGKRECREGKQAIQWKLLNNQMLASFCTLKNFRIAETKRQFQRANPKKALAIILRMCFNNSSVKQTQVKK